MATQTAANPALSIRGSAGRSRDARREVLEVLGAYPPLLKRYRRLVVVGALKVMAPVNNQQVAFHGRSIWGSLIGSIAETQEVIDFRARHGVSRGIEMLRIQDLNEACVRIEQGEVRYRYVVDTASLAEASVPTTLA